MPCSRTQHDLTRVGLDPRPLDPESEALTTRPPRSPILDPICSRRISKTSQLNKKFFLDRAVKNSKEIGCVRHISSNNLFSSIMKTCPCNILQYFTAVKSIIFR